MNKTCFVIAPLGHEGTEVRRRSDELTDFVIKPALEPFSYIITRIDRLSRPGNITRDIIQQNLEADLVIADISGSNPNVMYELGVRHSTGKPVVLMTSESDRIPFDISGIRVLVYDLKSVASIRDAVLQLRAFVSVLQASSTPDSPVFEAQAYRRFVAEVGADRDARKSTDTQDSVLKAIAERMGTLEARITDLAGLASSSSANVPTKYTRDVFIVHGHDGELKNELARLLERLEFHVIILHEQADKGQTIIQKLQYEGSRVGFAFILHTPDDEGRIANTDSALSPRSRQNVVFEHGMFVGRFTHSRVCAIVKQGVEIPSDLSGIVYKTIPSGGGIQSIALEIVRELRAADYVVDANKL
ncbi:MAG: nucleotide-binding protein [Nitrospira sp.]|nr:nucleotide-binding protein [Nitrospira sp.]MDH5348463.1 nucleotide-binding protein [Nitrospira sp.]